MNNTQLSIRHNWYSRVFIGLEISKIAGYRELAFLQHKEHCPAIRHINSGMYDILKKNFEAFKFFSRDYNLYYSLATIKEMPMFSFHPLERKKQQENFNENFDDYFTGYDFGIDFDGNKQFNKDLMYYKDRLVPIEKKHYGKEGIDIYDIKFNGTFKQVKPEELREIPKEEQIERAMTDMLVLKLELDAYNINYSVKFSGNKGFHINISDQNLPDIKPQEKVLICDKLTHEFSNILNLPTIDTALCQDRRIWKCPFSLIGEYVALPLSDKKIESFKLEDMKALNVLKDVKLKNMGLLERNSNLSLEIRKQNFKRMMNEYEISI